MTTLADLGYTTTLADFRKENQLEELEVGRVSAEHKDRYKLKTPEGEVDAELIGHLRFTSESRYDLPAVGDWVAFMPFDQDKGIIQNVYPRHSIIERKAPGKAGQIQIIATNIDTALIVQAVDRDFNINRIERYLTICYSTEVSPIIVLSKVDLIAPEKLNEITAMISERINDVPIIEVSNSTIGYRSLEQHIITGKTYCLLGSSGAGKSTLLNNLTGREDMKTGEISTAVNKGKHTTSHRELIVLPNGGIMIDNPGMREVGITDSSKGMETTFESLLSYAQDCKYADCTHTHEKGCAIIQGVEDGEISENAYTNYLKMEKEKEHFESDVLSRKKKDKDLGKVIKQFSKMRKDNKF